MDLEQQESINLRQTGTARALVPVLYCTENLQFAQGFSFDVAIRIRIHRLVFLLFHHEFMRFTPSTPRMVNPPYWKVFAKPKNTNHNTPFAAAEMGSAIWAKEMM